jgi:phage terminase small subunit
LPKPISADGLSDKMRRFCDEYLTDFNVKRAALAAGYSQKTAYKTGSENLSKPAVQRYLAERKQRIAEKLGYKAEDTIGNLIKIATFDIRNILEFGEEEIDLPLPQGADGKPDANAQPERVKRNYVRLKDSRELDDATAYAITGVTVKKDGSISIRTSDKKGALDTLARHQDLVKEAIDITSNGRTLIEGGGTNEREIARQVALLLMKGAKAGGEGPPR